MSRHQWLPMRVIGAVAAMTCGVAAAQGSTQAVPRMPASSGAIQWGANATQPAPAAPSALPPAPVTPVPPETKREPGAVRSAAPGARLDARVPVVAPAGSGAIRLSDVLAMSDAQPVPALGGGTMTAGEVKRRYVAWMRSELAQRKPAAALRVKRPGDSAVARVGAATQAPGAALRTVDAALISELRSLDTATLVRSGETTGLPARSGNLGVAAPGSRSARMPLVTAGASAQVPLPRDADTARSAQSINTPCTQEQAAFANGSTHYLSTVNKRPKDFWINLDADERHLVLSGCFDKTPGEVRVQGNFPNGYVKANVVLWEERVIVAIVPQLTGIQDQDVSVRVMLAGGRSTNERSGHLWAKREEKVLDDLTIFASSGDCPAKAFRGERGAGLIAYFPPKYPEGESSQGPFSGHGPQPDATCALPQGAATPSGVTRFKARLAPGWEVVNLSLRPLLGSARHEWVGDSDFDVHWTAASFTASHATLGIQTGSELFHALGFLVDQVVLRGPAATSPTGR